MSEQRADRKAAIRRIVREGEVHNQTELLELLKGEGFDVVRTTVSRDVTALGLEKSAEGVYLLPEDSKLRAVAKMQVRETRRAGNQVIVLTNPGAAQGMAAAIDAAQPEGILGTIAGDDTVLIIAQDDESGAVFQQKIDQLID